MAIHSVSHLLYFSGSCLPLKLLTYPSLCHQGLKFHFPVQPFCSLPWSSLLHFTCPQIISNCQKQLFKLHLASLLLIWTIKSHLPFEALPTAGFMAPLSPEHSPMSPIHIDLNIIPQSLFLSFINWVLLFLDHPFQAGIPSRVVRREPFFALWFLSLLFQLHWCPNPTMSNKLTTLEGLLSSRLTHMASSLWHSAHPKLNQYLPSPAQPSCIPNLSDTATYLLAQCTTLELCSTLSQRHHFSPQH